MSVPSFPAPDVCDALEFWADKFEDENPSAAQLLRYVSAELHRLARSNSKLRDALADISWDVTRAGQGRSTPDGALMNIWKEAAAALFSEEDPFVAQKRLRDLMDHWEKGICK